MQTVDPVEVERRIRRVKIKDAKMIKKARIDPAAFSEYTLRDEVDGRRVKNADHHIEWQHIWENNKWSVVVAPVAHGKTASMVARILYCLGRNPMLRIALVSDTATQAEKVLSSVRDYIARSKELHKVFPKLKRSTKDGAFWNQTFITVERDSYSKDPSVQALGVGGPINGSRVDMMIIDDAVSFESARSPTQRQKMKEWFDTTCITRLTEDATISAVGTPWHQEDLLHYLESKPDFYCKKYSAVENPDDPPEEWRVLWPARWTWDLLVKRRDNMAPSTWSRKYLSLIVSGETQRFKKPWIDAMVARGKKRGFLLSKPRDVNGQYMECYTGVDLGIGQSDSSALSVIFTIAIDKKGHRLIVNIESGRWTSFEIIERLKFTYAAYDSIIMVENNAAQQFLIDMCDGEVPVQGRHTGKNKHHEQFGVEALATELARNWWIMPSGRTGTGVDVPDEGKTLIEGMTVYDPETHTADHLMAMWIARECARDMCGDRMQLLDTQTR